MKSKKSKINLIYKINNFSLDLQKICDRNFNCHYTERLTSTQIRKKITEKELDIQALLNFHAKSKNQQEILLPKMSI